MGAIFPPQIYTEYLRDPATRARWWVNAQQVSQLAATIVPFFDVPQDYDLHLSHLTAVALGGGAQTVSGAYVAIERTPGAVPQVYLLYQLRPVPVGIEISEKIVSGVVIPAGSRVIYPCTFSAAAFANTAFLHTVGILLPRLELLS